jgi:hypothetical protein
MFEEEFKQIDMNKIKVDAEYLALAFINNANMHYTNKMTVTGLRIRFLENRYVVENATQRWLNELQYYTSNVHRYEERVFSPVSFALAAALLERHYFTYVSGKEEFDV